MIKIVSVVLGSFNRLPYLRLAIDSIRTEVAGLSHEIIVVDGGSDDGSMAWLAEQKDIITVVQHNRGQWLGKPIERRSWGYFMNLAFKMAQGEFVCMLSDDCLLVPGAIVNGIAAARAAQERGIQLGGVAFYFRDWSKEEVYHVGYTLGDNMYVNHGLFTNEALAAVGYIDEKTCFFYNGDGDLCLEMKRAGYEVIDSPTSFIEHYPHANLDVRSTNYERYKTDISNYLKKWEGIYYDPLKNNLGKQQQLAFNDVAKTGERFLRLHETVIAARPDLARPKPVYHKVVRQLRWKWQAAMRKTRSLWR